MIPIKQQTNALSGLCVTLVMASLGWGPAMAQEREVEESVRSEAFKELDRLYPEAPQEIVSDFVAAVKQGPMYALADSLRVERVRRLASDWSGEIGRFLGVHSTRFLVNPSGRLVFGTIHEVVSKDRKLRLEKLNYSPKSEQKFRFRAGVPLLILHLETAEDVPDKSYRVDSSRLAELDFEHLSRLDVMSPLLRPLERYSTRGKSLSDVVTDLCTQAGVEIAYQFDLASNVTIMQEARNRTIQQCLEAAAHVAGLDVRYNGKTRLTGDVITIGAIAAEAASRELLRELSGSGAGRVDPVEVLRALVEEKSSSRERVMVSLEPRRDDFKKE